MTPDEKKVLAEMLGLHIYADTLLVLRDARAESKAPGGLCASCFMNNRGCSEPPSLMAPSANDVCGAYNIFEPWSPGHDA